MTSKDELAVLIAEQAKNGRDCKTLKKRRTKIVCCFGCGTDTSAPDGFCNRCEIKDGDDELEE